jgi:hypothetical protein
MVPISLVGAFLRRSRERDTLLGGVISSAQRDKVDWRARDDHWRCCDRLG